MAESPIRELRDDGAPNTVLQPPGWPRPKGFANGILARGEGSLGSGDRQSNRPRRDGKTLLLPEMSMLGGHRRARTQIEVESQHLAV